MKKLRFPLLCFGVLLSMGSALGYAEALGEDPISAFNINATPLDIPWLSEKARLRNKIQADSCYFYIAPFYEESRWVSLFVPFEIGRHHIWWDSGSIISSGSGGYRYVLDQSYIKQNWFWGVYCAHAYHGLCFTRQRRQGLSGAQDFYRENVGLEIGGSRLGQLTVNGYWILGRTQRNAPKWIAFYSIAEGRKLLPVIENKGISVKWVSIPNQRGIQWHAVLARTQVQETSEQSIPGDAHAPASVQYTFAMKNVWRFAVGMEFNISDWARVELQWRVMDVYKPFSLRPSIGFKLFGVKERLVSDPFQQRLKRPPQYHTPLYAGFAPIDCLAPSYVLRKMGF